MVDKIPTFILPQTTSAQEEFITHYIDKHYKKKKADKQAMLHSAWLTYLSSRQTCSEVVDQVSYVARSQEDYDFVRDIRLKCAEAIAKIKPGWTKGLSDATAQIVQVAEDLVALKTQALQYMRSQAQAGRDIGEEAAIKLIIANARTALLEANAAFNTEAEVLRAKVRKQAPNVSWDPVEVEAFRSIFKESSNALLVIPTSGDDASETSAQTAADEAVTAVEDARDDLIQKMQGFADGDAFRMFVADMRRRDAVVTELQRTREALEQLDRWSAPEANGISSRANAIEKEIEHVFADRSGLSESAATAAEEAQDNLLEKATELKDEAIGAVASTESAFDTQIDELRPQVERLEQRWAACKRKVGKTQGAPIEAQIGAMRLSLDGLRGFNTAAIDAIKKMIKVSTDLVVEAEHIDELNQRITGILTDADNKAKALTGSTNPIADVFAKHRTEIAEFKAGFKEKSLTEATKGAQDLLKQVEADVTRNQALIDRRRDIMARIGRREEQLARFNELFRSMLEKAGQTPQDYRGSFKADIETCKSWAATKTDPDFYDTIDAKLTSILTEMEKEAGVLRRFAEADYQQLLLDAATAATKHRDANLDLNRQDGAALAKMGKAQADIAALRKRQEDGENVTEELQAAADALQEAQDARKDIADERAKAQKEYDDATVLLDHQQQLVDELAKAEAADAMAARKRDEFLETSKAWLSEIKSEVGNNDSVLHDYKDEAEPQIKRIENSRKMLKNNDPGVTGESALSELKFVKDFLEGLRKRGKKTDKRNLGDIGTQWEQEVLKINRAASELITAIEDFEKFPAVGGTASADVEKMFGIIMGRMMDHKFEQAARKFNESDDRQVRKAAREEALSEVRRYRALMFNDPLLQKCVMNPFGVAVGSTTANRLDEIELNVLRGI